MEIIIKPKLKKIKQKYLRDLYWFNPVDKKMYHGMGSKLEFTYNKEYKISVPKVITEEIQVDSDDLDDIKKWVKASSEKYSFSVDYNGKNITLNFNIAFWNNIVEEMIQNGFNFEYDDKDLKKEIKKYVTSRNS